MIKTRTYGRKPKVAPVFPVPKVMGNVYSMASYFTMMRDDEKYTSDDYKAWFEIYCKEKGIKTSHNVTKKENVILLMNLVNNGHFIPPEYQCKIDNYVKALPKPVKRTSVVSVEVKKKDPNEKLYAILNLVDMKVDGHIVTIDVPPALKKSVIEYCVAEMKSIDNDIETQCTVKRHGNKLKSIYSGIIEQCEEVKKSIVKVPTNTRKSKAAQVKGVKFSKDKIQGKSSFTPDTIIGKKNLWVYDTGKSLLIHYRSPLGFMFSGTTLKNFTEMKGYTVKDVETLPMTSFTGIDAYAKTLRERNTGVTARFSDNTYILGVS